MPRLQLPEDAKQISKYGDHELAGLYYSPSQKCLYNSYKIVRKVNIEGRNGFYTRKKSDKDEVRTLYISIAKLLKQYAELADILEWTKPPRAKGAHLTKAKGETAADEEAKADETDDAKKAADSPKGDDDEIKIDFSDEENREAPPSGDDQKPKKKKKGKSSKQHGIDREAPPSGVDSNPKGEYDSAFKAMRNAVSAK